MVRKISIHKNILAKYLLAIGLTAGIFIYAPAQNKKQRKRQQKIEQVIQTARSYLGTPYKWGGTTQSGIDCSGLIQNSYRAVGVQLPRVAKHQSKEGKKKNWNSLRPGDLVYFTFNEKGRKKWYHSGMITKISDHEILFIHASSSKGVVESNLLTNYYKSNVKRFRRVIK